MKVKTKALPQSANPSTTVIGLPDGRVEITHSLSIKQSVGYQTGDVMYGIKIVTHNSKAEILKGIRQCETLVEDAVSNKMPEMREALQELAKANAR